MAGDFCYLDTTFSSFQGNGAACYSISGEPAQCLECGPGGNYCCPNTSIGDSNGCSSQFGNAVCAQGKKGPSKWLGKCKPCGEVGQPCCGNGVHLIALQVGWLLSVHPSSSFQRASRRKFCCSTRADVLVCAGAVAIASAAPVHITTPCSCNAVACRPQIAKRAAPWVWLPWGHSRHWKRRQGQRSPEMQERQVLEGRGQAWQEG